MEFNEIRLTKRFVWIFSAVLFIVVTLFLTVLSLVLNNEPPRNVISDMPSSDEYKDQDAFAENDESSLNEISIEGSIEEIVDDGFVSEEALEHGWVINEYGYTYLYDDAGYEQFTYTNFTLNRFIDSINEYSNIFSENTNIYNMVVPVSSTFASIPREIYTDDEFYNKSQTTFVSTVSANLDSKIKNIPIVSILEERYDEGEYVFFRTDRNWTQLGAYYAYTEFCRELDIVPLELGFFQEETISDYLGSFYNATGSRVMYNDPDKMIFYSLPDSIHADLTVYDADTMYFDYAVCDNYVYPNTAYNVFLGREAERYEITTNSEGGTLLIIGDSSVFPIIPFLSCHYSKIDFIYPEKYTGDIIEFVAEKEYNDVLLMCYSTSAVNSNYIPSLKNITGVKIDE